MRLFRPASPRQLDLALAVLRVVAGVIFAAHGAQKLFIYGLGSVADAFGQMGIPLADLTGPAVALVEFLGGLALVLGLVTRLAGFGLALVMLGAMLLVHLKGGLFLPNGFEYVLALLGVVGTLTVTGAGRYSLDAIVARRGRAGSRDVGALRRAI